VLVIERETGTGRITSSRNSGVIHAGIYYPAGSLKARTCTRGRTMLYERAAERGIAHRKTTKLIVAVDDTEITALEKIQARAEAAGVTLTMLDRGALKSREPKLRGVAALHSPESGVIDVHGVVDTFRAEARAHDADLALATWAVGLSASHDHLVVDTENARGERLSIRAPWVVNAAGLDADRIAALAGLDVDALGYRLHPCKGDYFALATAAPRPETALVYPVPDGPGLGIHLTVDLGGRCIAGPDATFVDSREDYAVDESKAEAFAESVARYLPGVATAHLTPDYSGIRPRLAGPGEKFRDFVIEEASAHGAPGLVNLIGIESPGLTASPAIAEHVAAIIDG
jgi:L-2-hydroxyglutarate oxidase LhgO